MKSLGNPKWRLLLLLSAYVALLAHAFIPHHHHSDYTAFINAKSCPHEHHGHVDTDPVAPAHSAHSDQCETLQHVLLSDTQTDQSGVTDDVDGSNLIAEVLTAFMPLAVVENEVFQGTRLRWIPDVLPDLISKNTSRRGPPTLS